MALWDIFTKAKKKVEDFFTPARQTVRSGLSGIAQKARSFEQGAENVGRSVGNFVQKYPTPASYVAPKIKSYFEPTSQVRARDVVREIPAAIPKAYRSLKSGNLGNDISRDLEKFDYFKPTEKVRARDFVRELPKGIHETGKSFVQDAARFAISTAEIPKTLATGKASGKYYNTPFGRINSFQSEAQNRVQRGDPLWKAIGNPAMDTLLGAGDVAAVAKPLLSSAKNLAKFGKAGKEVASVADDLTKPLGKTMKMKIPARTEQVSPNIYDSQPGMGTFRVNKKTGKLEKVAGFQMTRDAKPTRIREMSVDVPFEFQSNTMKSLQRPGLTIKSVAPDSFEARMAAKTAKAKQLVGKQLENQRRGALEAEKGFVSPKMIKPKDAAKIEDTADAFKREMESASPFKVGSVEQKLFDEASKPLPPLKPGEVNLDQLAEMEDAARGIDDVPFRGDEFSREFRPIKEAMAERKGVQAPPRVGEVLENNINKRPYVREPKTIEGIYDTYVAPAGKKTEELVKTSGDLLEKTPAGRRARIDKGEINVFNYSNELRSIGAARTKKELEKIGYKEGLGLIENWKAKHDPEYFVKKAERERFKDFVSDFQASEEKGIKRGLEYIKKYSDLPADKAEQIIYHLDTPGQAPDDIAPIVQNLRKEFDDFHVEAKNSGLDVGFWQDYITHIWAESPQTVAKKIAAGLKKGIITADDLASPNNTKTPFFRPANARMLKTYEAGERIGLHKKYNHPAQIVAHYAKQLEKAKSIAKNINILKEEGSVVDGIQQGMKALNIPGMDGMSARPDLAKRINHAFEQHEYTGIGKVLEGAAFLSRGLKEMLMSGGIPASTVNSYGIGMTLKEIGTLSPTRAKNALSSFIMANSPKHSRQFFIDNIKQIEKIKKNDIMVSTMLDNGGFVGKGFWKDILGEGRIFGANSNHWQKMMNEPTFKRYLPMNQIKFFNSIESRLLKKGYSAKQAEKIAAKELREGMGIGSAAKEAGKSQVYKDWRETLFFAPTHRMNMIRVFGNAAKALGRNPLKPGNQSAAQFLLGGVAVYAMYDLVNYRNTGKHLYENPTGKKFEAYIKVGDKGDIISIPFMPTVATMPRLGIDVAERLGGGDLGGAFGRAWQGTGSILGKPLADVVMNKDYFDRPIADENDPAGKQYADRAKYLGKSYTGHPWIKAGIDKLEGKPTGQVLVQATEAPIRFTTENDLAKKEFYDEFKKYKPLAEKYDDLRRYEPKKAAEFYKNNKEQIDAYKKYRPYEQAFNDKKYDEKNPKEDFGIIKKALAANKGGGEFESDSDLDVAKSKYDFERSEKNANEASIKKLLKDESLSLEEKQELAKQLDDDSKSGISDDADTLMYVFGIDKYAKENKEQGIRKYTFESNKIDVARQIYDGSNEKYKDLTDEQKDQIFDKFGMKKDDIEYDYIANQKDAVKSQFLMSALAQEKDHGKLLDFLVENRKESIGGNILASNGAIDDLYENGLISKSERTQLKKIKIGKDGQVKASSGSGEKYKSQRNPYAFDPIPKNHPQLAAAASKVTTTSMPRMYRVRTGRAAAPRKIQPKKIRIVFGSKSI